MWEKGWRKEAKRAKLGRRKRRALYLNVLAAAFVVLAMAGGLTWASRAPALSVKNLDIHGSRALSHDVVREVVERMIDHPLAFALGRKNIVLYPRAAIARAILELDPKIASVDVSAVALDSVVVTLEERRPVALWCSASENVQAPCYFLDRDGYLFALAPEFSGPVFTRFYGPLSSAEPLRATLLDSTTFRSLIGFIEKVGELGLKTESLLVRDEYDYELLLTGGSKIFFARSDELSRVLENLSSVLSSETFKERGALSLEYIDLRFGNKVYYRYTKDSSAQ